MYIVGIAASPRKGGNSEILLDKALEGAAAKGAFVKKISISEIDISPCLGCQRCKKNGACWIRDDMRYIYRQLDRADGIVVSSPVYFGSVPAQLKSLIDRCQAIWIRDFVLNKNRRKKTHRKKGAFILVSAGKNKRFFENSKEIIKIWFMVLGVGLTTGLYVSGVEDAGDVLKKTPVLDRAFACGSKLPDQKKRRAGKAR